MRTVSSASARLAAAGLILLASGVAVGQTVGTSVRVGPLVLDLISPQPFSYQDGQSFTLVTLSGAGTAEAPVTAVNLDLGPGNSSQSGCLAADFADFPLGDIALIQRGGCPFLTKAENALAAGASAILIFNQGNNAANLGLADIALTSTEGDAFSGDVPVFFLTYSLGEALSIATNVVMRVEAPVFRGSRHEAYLRFCLANRDQCTLSVRFPDENWSRSINGDRLQVTASVYKILMLIAYAEAVVAKDLDPTTVISRDEWARFSVRRDGGALQNAFNRLGSPETVTLFQMMNVMMRESDNAAPDWLLAELGRERVADVARRYLGDAHDPPESINAAFVTFDGHPLEADPAPRVLASYSGFQSPGFQTEVAEMFELMDISGYAAQVRQYTCVPLPWAPLEPGCQSGFITTGAQYRQLLGRYFMRADANSYARLMERMLDGSAVPPDVYAVMQPHIEWFFDLDGVGDDFQRYGGKGGSFGPQNVCNFAGFAEATDGTPVAIATFVRDALHACGVGLHAQLFMQQLVLDPDFRALVRNETGWDDLLFRGGFEDRLAE